MNRVVLGAFAALLLVAAGIFWWQGRAETEIGTLPQLPAGSGTAPADLLPDADGKGLRGPAPPEATEITREQRRFDRLDRDRDARITRTEMLLPRVPDFRKLDKDGNNLLSFEEWAGRTVDRFGGADANRNGSLDRREFATTKPVYRPKPVCRCPPAPRRGSGSSSRAVRPAVDDEETGDDAESGADEADPASEL